MTTNANIKKDAKTKKTPSRSPALQKKTAPDVCSEKSPVEKPIPAPDKLIKIWFNGWKQTFNYKGRTSRFELWVFLLINTILMTIFELKCTYILSERFLRYAKRENFSLQTIDFYITTAQISLYLILFIPVFPTVAMLIRRQHDLGKSAWKNYLEPLFMGLVILSLLLITLIEVNNTAYAYTALSLGVCSVTILYSVGFYAIKFLTMTLFDRGDSSNNAFGTPSYKDNEHEEKALTLSTFFFLLILTLLILHLATAIL